MGFDEVERFGDDLIDHRPRCRMFSGLIAHFGRVAALRGDVRNGMVLTVEAPDAVAEGVADKD